jgi:hypothetical protein
MNKKMAAFYLLVLVLSSAGCSFLNSHLSPTATLTPTSTIIPPTPTIITPTSTSVPPSPTPQNDCTKDQVISELKSDPLFMDYSIFYNQIMGFDILSIYFVDSNIDTRSTGVVFQNNVDIAKRDAITISHTVNLRSQCIEDLFTFINPIVVDSNHNGWFSGAIEPLKLPSSQIPTEIEYKESQDKFKVSYIKQQFPSPKNPAPEGSCTWEQARENIHRHFDSSRPNVEFSFVIDESSVHVDAQWDSNIGDLNKDLWWSLQMASILNVQTELACLYPVPSTLNVTIVDSDGKIILLGQLPNPSSPVSDLAINDFKIIYSDY